VALPPLAIQSRLTGFPRTAPGLISTSRFFEEGVPIPEAPEVDTEKLHETIHGELEHEGDSFLKRIALTTAILAAFAAIASLRAGATVNEALVLKTQATRLQAEASGQWPYYQAKGLKAAVQEASVTAWLAIGKEPPAKYLDEQKRY
jgi:Domain of unknown function (DUF4337)